jgi:hypothetical protein
VDNTDLKRRAKGCLLSTLTTGSGWLKMTLQDDYRADPMQYNRINDAQDNVAEIEALQRELDEPAADEEAVAEALKFQTAHVEAALQGQSELFVQKGLVIDRVAAEDLIILDDAVLELADYAKAEAIGQRVWMTADVYKRVFATAELPKGAKRFGKDKGEAMIKAGDSADDCLLEVWEVWDKGCGHVFTFARGADDWAREPYSPALILAKAFSAFGQLCRGKHALIHIRRHPHPLPNGLGLGIIGQLKHSIIQNYQIFGGHTVNYQAFLHKQFTLSLQGRLHMCRLKLKRLSHCLLVCCRLVQLALQSLNLGHIVLRIIDAVILHRVGAVIVLQRHLEPAAARGERG